ncbi:MAG: hypothetical protein WCJ09_19995 [Planctomycetota bacterium]
MSVITDECLGVAGRKARDYKHAPVILSLCVRQDSGLKTNHNEPDRIKCPVESLNRSPARAGPVKDFHPKLIPNAELRPLEHLIRKLRIETENLEF